MARTEIFPSLAYRDPKAAMAFLRDAFGFEELACFEAPDGSVMHAEMALDDVVVMLGSEKPDMGWVSPLSLDSVNQVISIGLDDVDGHHRRASAAGAEIIRELQDTDYGAREYGAKDPEGHQWHFTTYRPTRDG